MKRLILVLLLLAGIRVQAQQQKDTGVVYMFCYFKGNSVDGLHLAYSEDAYHWTALNDDSTMLRPEVAKDKLMRDPCIIRGGDGKFHMVWTVSWKDKGIGYASSEDLVHWSKQEYIPVMEHEAGAQNAWAPELVYDEATKQYVIYWATTIPGRFPATDSLGDNNHRIYYTTTKDFATFSKAAILYDKGFNIIDATILRNGKKYVMFLKDETKTPPQKNLHVATSKKLLSGWSAPSPSITGKYWAEGPTAIFANNSWIVYFDKYRDHKYGAVTSIDLKNWTDISDKVSFPKGTRHGTVFTITRAEFNRLANLLY
ncbi:Glycosyl hydrolases family 43 [Filimonas lacunae]|uniref:Glycosyl hydrolases family 43 n=1 Tax=Filimonas lacunae TaxID=477680 RepID=A0A173MMI8_9BACT|nr:glycoside hydrolase family 43 protein [Filimonas lacunae]BAV08863.1 beta-galactosidase [Filimonas lacunae]SIS62986.1 Glycosyl hydrolases family 43 [Filimonas lacunae]